MTPDATEGEVRVVARPETARGFRLAGLEVRAASDASAAEAALRDLVDDADVAVVFVQRRHFDALPGDLRREVESITAPVVVPFPDPSWREPEAAEERVVELLRRAVGYRVQLR